MAPNLGKIKGFLKKCRSFGTLGRSYSSLICSPMPHNEETSVCDSTESRSSSLVHADISDEAPKGCKVVYVGKSRRRYFINAHYLNHPLIRVFVQRCEEDNEDGLTVCCEVVMFQHLVWMLDNTDPEAIQSDSFEELAQFYACT
ncbi:hypothetical protein SUGI_0758810 [Cryptomeria japonica]|uniref:auxin-responsive protein SAUR76-like n=1 Tax=Cryptomeria japonica TaxID=3369 RepID=UPI0024148656|nr:auxin-responsive protein SAUR76-like [Cryptomeria japonica]GLJ37388.1 hypothetical protein SUGI_0758810 [Cryptomeria japonica]